MAYGGRGLACGTARVWRVRLIDISYSHSVPGNNWECNSIKSYVPLLQVMSSVQRSKVF